MRLRQTKAVCVVGTADAIVMVLHRIIIIMNTDLCVALNIFKVRYQDETMEQKLRHYIIHIYHTDITSQLTPKMFAFL